MNVSISSSQKPTEQPRMVAPFVSGRPSILPLKLGTRRYQIRVPNERTDILRIVGIRRETGFIGASDAHDHGFMNALAGFFSVPSRNTYAAHESRQKSPHFCSRVDQSAHRSIDAILQVFVIECERPIAGLLACHSRLCGHPEKGGIRKTGVGMTAADIRMTSGKPHLFQLLMSCVRFRLLSRPQRGLEEAASLVEGHRVVGIDDVAADGGVIEV